MGHGERDPQRESDGISEHIDGPFRSPKAFPAPLPRAER